MIYLLGIVGVAARGSQGAAVFASVLSVLAYDFFFVPPYLTFAVSDVQYLLTFGVMLVVALLISSLTIRTKAQAQSARQRERRTATLYEMSRELARTRDFDHILQIARKRISEIFGSQVAIFLPNPNGQLTTTTPYSQDPKEQGVAQWVYDHRQLAGSGTQTLPGVQGVYFPLVAPHKVLGVLGMLPEPIQPFLTPEQLQLLETLINQIALAMERVLLSEEAQQARLQVETERLRNALLSSVSHDLRTPLTIITGATSSLLTKQLDALTQQKLTQTVADEAQRLNLLVRNLLDMTRLESGAIQVHKEWQPLEEVVGSALHRLAQQLQTRPLTLDLPADLPLIPLDAVLIEQVLVNLLENALKYTPEKSPLTIRAWVNEQGVTIELADQGPGIALADREAVFEKFYRVQSERGGSGLGLTICRGIVTAHGGKIWVEAVPGGGASFRFTLPIEGEAPPFAQEMLEHS
jgi:two-component system sensor histidine kinase KdpD